MKTVLSFIVQKRLSAENENVATEALNFIINSSGAARGGLMKLLHGIIPELPNLRFEIQHTEGNIRPDMCGMDSDYTRVFIENKFWAGLTDNQPIQYLNFLSGHDQPSILLVVVPEARQETVWRELLQRLDAANISYAKHTPSIATYGVVKTGMGPFLALISWNKLLSAIEIELIDEPLTRNDLLQLRSLCEVADDDAFIPLSAEELTNQRYPALIFQLNSVVKTVVEQGVTEGFISIKGLMPTHFWDGIGRYFKFSKTNNIYAWIGIRFRYWLQYGTTPLWVVFTDSCDVKARLILKSWAEKDEVLTIPVDDKNFAMSINLPAGEELDVVVRAVVKRLRDISKQLSVLQD